MDEEGVASRSAPLEHKQGRLFEFSHIMEQEQAKAALAGMNGSVSYVSAYHSVGSKVEPKLDGHLRSLAS
jgi:hypothetical protein